MLKCENDESIGIVLGAMEDASDLLMISCLTLFTHCVHTKKVPLIFSL